MPTFFDCTVPTIPPFVWPELTNRGKIFWMLTEAAMVASITFGGMEAHEFNHLCRDGFYQGFADPAANFGGPAALEECQIPYSYMIMEQITRAGTWYLMRYFGFSYFMVSPFDSVFAGPILDGTIGGTLWTSYSWIHARPNLNQWVNCEGGDSIQANLFNAPGDDDCEFLRWDNMSVLFGWVATLGMAGELFSALIDTCSSRPKLDKIFGKKTTHKLTQYPNTSWCFSLAPHVLIIAGIVCRAVFIEDNREREPFPDGDADAILLLDIWDLVLYTFFSYAILYMTSAAANPDRTFAQLAVGPLVTIYALSFGLFTDSVSTPFWEACAIASGVSGWIGCSGGTCDQDALQAVSDVLRWFGGYILADRFIRATMVALARGYQDYLRPQLMRMEEEAAASEAQLAETGVAAPLLMQPLQLGMYVLPRQRSYHPYA
ncbi:unnamed protein product [Chrysoparadoxa australica]